MVLLVVSTTKAFGYTIRVGLFAIQKSIMHCIQVEIS